MNPAAEPGIAVINAAAFYSRASTSGYACNDNRREFLLAPEFLCDLPAGENRPMGPRKK